MKSIRRACGAGAGVLLLAVLFSPASDGQSQKAADGAKSKLQTVLKQRRDTLADLVKVVQAQYQQAQAGLQSVVKAQNELIQAEMELAPDQAARIRLLEQQLENMKQLETSTNKAHELGGIGQAEVLSVRAERLRAEVELLRAQSSEK